MLKTFALALCAAALAAFSQPALANITIGGPAPDFTLPSASGGDVSLSSFAGKIVVLEWHNKGCPFVKKHYGSGNMQALQKEYAAKDVVWLTVNSSAPGKQGHETAEEAMATAKEAEAAPAHILLDADGKVGKLYSAKTTPDMVVIGKDGTVAYSGAIDDKPSPDPDDIKTATNYVRAALDALLEGKAVETTSTTPYGCSVKYAD